MTYSIAYHSRQRRIPRPPVSSLCRTLAALLSLIAAATTQACQSPAPGEECGTQGEQASCEGGGYMECVSCTDGDREFCPKGGGAGRSYWSACNGPNHCAKQGEPCQGCCSNLCYQGRCVAIGPDCLSEGACASPADCCSGSCNEARCRNMACEATDGPCTTSAQCCYGVCNPAGQCSFKCFADTLPCSSDLQCCSLHCDAAMTCAPSG